MDSSQTESLTVQITARLTTNGRIRTNSVELDLALWSPLSIFRRAILHHAGIWKLDPPHYGKIDNLRAAIRYSHAQPIDTELLDL